MKFFDDMKKALLAAQAIKDAAEVKTLRATAENLEEMATSSPRTPGYDEHIGKAMKPPALWPQVEELQRSEQDREPDHDIDR